MAQRNRDTQRMMFLVEARSPAVRFDGYIYRWRDKERARRRADGQNGIVVDIAVFKLCADELRRCPTRVQMEDVIAATEKRLLAVVRDPSQKRVVPNGASGQANALECRRQTCSNVQYHQFRSGDGHASASSPLSTSIAIGGAL